jgi:hypothetical protein
VNIIIRGKHSETHRLTQKDLDKNFGHLEDHQYRHFNRALGCEVKSKEHYIELMEKGGFVPQEVGERLAQEQRKNTRKDYKGLEEKTMRAISDLKSTTSKKGKLSSLSGTKRAMESVGVKFETLNKLPKGPDKDGFYDV